MKQSDIEAHVLGYLDLAISMELNLSGDHTVYDLQYIGDKLATCGKFLEELSNMQLHLTRTGLAVTKATHGARGTLRLEEQELKASRGYAETERNSRAHWLNEQLSDMRTTADSWIYLTKVVSDVKEAVGDRVQMMKRLDSDIRLHQKLLEVKVASGAVSPNFISPTSGVGEIDL